MRSALAKGLGVKEDAITVDYSKKTATVAMGDAKPDLTALKSALESSKYTATVQ